jgi:hypothetical protein
LHRVLRALFHFRTKVEHEIGFLRCKTIIQYPEYRVDRALQKLNIDWRWSMNHVKLNLLFGNIIWYLTDLTPVYHRPTAAIEYISHQLLAHRPSHCTTSTAANVSPPPSAPSPILFTPYYNICLQNGEWRGFHTFDTSYSYLYWQEEITNNAVVFLFSF